MVYVRTKTIVNVALLLLVVLLSGCSLFAGKPGTVEVALVLADETPIKNIELRLSEEDKVVDKGFTNQEGLVKLSAKAGKYQLEGTVETVSGEIAINEEVTIEKDKTVNKVITLDNLAILSINVKDKYNQPLAGAEIVLKDKDRKQVTKVQATIDSVEYLLEGGDYFIDVTKDDATVQDHDVKVTSGVVKVNINLDTFTTTNVAFGKGYKMLKQAQSSYPDAEGTKLTDGLTGEASIYDTAWVGNLGEPDYLQVVVVDLGKEYVLFDTNIVGLKDGPSGVELPVGITVAVSSDGENWTQLDRVAYERPEENPVVITHSYELNQNARFVAYKIEHYTNWLFVSEIEVIGAVGSDKPVEGDLAAIDLEAIFM